MSVGFTGCGGFGTGFMFAQPGGVSSGRKTRPDLRGRKEQRRIDMAGKGKDAEAAHPETVRYLESLSPEAAAEHAPVVRRHTGGFTRYWVEDGSVRSCETGDPGRPVEAGLDPLLKRMRSEFGRLLPRAAADLAGEAPDLDAIERSIRDGALAGGGTALKALLEDFDARLPAPRCGKCGMTMVRHRLAAKRFTTRFGDIEIRRVYRRCRGCGDGFHPLDRILGIEGETWTPGAASVIADAVSDGSYDEAARKLASPAGVRVHVSRIKRAAVRIGGLARRFERESVEESEPAADRVYLVIDGTGVPVRKEEAEGRAGRRENGPAKTREAKIALTYTAERRHPETGEPEKDAGSGSVSCLIDSAASVNGVSRRSEFAARLEREAARAGLRGAGELVVISDGASWIRNVCAELFPGPRTVHILDLWHAMDYAAAAVKALRSDPAERRALREWIRSELKAGRADSVIAFLKPRRGKAEAVDDCVRYFESNRDRMRYDAYRARGMQIGSGVVESACRHVVGQRMKRSGGRWTVEGANAVLAIRRCLKNLRWPDFLDWKVRNAATA